MTATNPPELARLLAEKLDAEGVPYAIGGAVAYGFWGVPRATNDLDINLFLPAEQAREALRVLLDAGVALDVQAAIASGQERGDAKGYYGDLRVDIFFLSIPFHESAARRTITVQLLATPVRVLAAEDLIVCKMLFFRGKDIPDVERMLAMQASKLDRAYVRNWLVDCVGAEDVRTKKWDALCAQLPAD